MSDNLALLQTDVVGSTRVSERLGDAAMSALWQAHDRIARDLLRKWRGREIDKSDGFLLLFDEAADAVGYALAYHHALGGLSEPLQARAGVHVGPLIIRENSADDVARGAKPIEVDGLAKPTVARVMSLALGGQTLMTASARDRLDAGTHHVKSHGYWRLQGIEAPLELFEVGGAAASFTPPPDSAKAYRVVRRAELWLPLHDVRHSLPAERDVFIGRQASLQELARRFGDGARLISILGIGGTGKTRLAQRFGWSWLGDFPGGVWFCDLSQARGLDGIVHAVGQGLEVPLGTTDPVVQIGDAIAGRGPCLVILDNFEQVAEHAQASLGRWLDRAGEARFIATTREVLGIPGEEAFELTPLSERDAVALLVQRATAARPDFQLSDQDSAAIGPLVKLLDGLPLAIELAAARVRVMSPHQLLERMGERFTLLASARGRTDRHATLHKTLDWSWDLLNSDEQTALAQLSVFDGGFTLGAAEQVVALPAGGQGRWTVDVVQALADKSLLRRAGDGRFDLLVSVKEYGGIKLRTAGSDACDAAQRRHWSHFARDRKGNRPDLADLENLVTACRRSTLAADAQAAVATLRWAWDWLKVTGPFGVAVDLAADIRKLPGLEDAERAGAEWIAACALDTLGKVAEAADAYQASLAAARAAGDSTQAGWIFCALGEQQCHSGSASEAQVLLHQAWAIAESLDHPGLRCRVLNVLGALASREGRSAEAHGHYEGALALALSMGDRRWESGLRGNLAVLAHDAGQSDAALTEYERALGLAKEAHERRWEGNMRCNLGLLHHEQGRSAEARSEFESALAIAREIGDPRLEAMVRCNLGISLQANGDHRAASVQFEEAVATAVRLGDQRREGQFRGYFGACLAALGRYAESREQLRVGEGQLIALSDNASLALLLCQRADAELLEGNSEAAQAALKRVDALTDRRESAEISDYYEKVLQRLAMEHTKRVTSIASVDDFGV